MATRDAPSTTSPNTALRWDIFCHVIDNYGDIGVSWRLARQLAREHLQHVQLWVDKLSVLAAMVPAMVPDADSQTLDGVRIRHWRADWAREPVADVLVEAFGCTVPQAYLAAMSASQRPAVWLNLEYLSAEAWVEGCHGLPSKVAGSLQKYFFFPGFTEKTGGLPRERDLITRRDQFQADSAARTGYLSRYGVYPRPGAMLVSLFSYENPGLGGWLDGLSQHDQPVCLLIPEGRILGDVQRWLGTARPTAGNHIRRGTLDIHILPFLTQDDYDRLLWCCDFNIVRGEDSFVRAQWAGAPLLWHIYPQDEDAHRVKLDAFLRLYTQGLSEGTAAALRQFWLAWNEGANPGASWRHLQGAWPELREGAKGWCDQQAARKNISQQLVTFAQKRLIFAPKNS